MSVVASTGAKTAFVNNPYTPLPCSNPDGCDEEDHVNEKGVGNFHLRTLYFRLTQVVEKNLVFHVRYYGERVEQISGKGSDGYNRILSKTITAIAVDQKVEIPNDGVQLSKEGQIIVPSGEKITQRLATKLEFPEPYQKGEILCETVHTLPGGGEPQVDYSYCTLTKSLYAECTIEGLGKLKAENFGDLMSKLKKSRE